LRSPEATNGHRRIRRRALNLACVNAGFWATGNGLTSTGLVVYLARELGAKGIEISLILAIAPLLGVLRMVTPALAPLVGDRRRFCLLAYSASFSLLIALPLLSAPGVLPTRDASMAALIALWTVYHLLEYLGTVSLWSWLGDLCPRQVRGRFIGQRERWLVVGRIAGMLGAGLFAYWWRETFPRDVLWIGYAIPSAAGAVMMLVSLVPISLMPNVESRVQKNSMGIFRRTFAPLVDRRFQRLLLFGCWFSFFNGVTQTPQNIYHIDAGIPLLLLLGYRCGMRLGQSGIAPTVGRLVDRLGNRPVMIVSQLIVATGPLFYVAASCFGSPGWIALAFVVWIAYAGLNVALPNIMLKLSPGQDYTPYTALFFGVTGVFFGLSTIVGGILWDVIHKSQQSWQVFGISFGLLEALFVFGWLMRSLAVVWLLWIIEPGAWNLRVLLSRRR
jgi:MFS family permease